MIQRRIDDNGATVRLFLTEQVGAPELRRALHDAFVRRRAARIVLDAAGLDDIGSECLELLLVGYTRALCAGLGYEVVNAHGDAGLALDAVSLCELYPRPVRVPHLPPREAAARL